jgi:hypothetical protein
MVHEQTSRHVRVMSVLPLKSDMRQREWHVRYVPTTDIARFFERVIYAAMRPPHWGHLALDWRPPTAKKVCAS